MQYVGVAAHRYGSFVLFVVIWAAASSALLARGVPGWVLPPPQAVAAELAQAMSTGVLPTYLSSSLVHLLLAGSSGLCAGVVVGILLGLNRHIARFFYPLVNFFQALGGVAFAPLIIVWFGYSTVGLIVAVNYTIFFPVAFSSLTGVSTVPPIYANAVRTLGANRWHVIRDVILPGALPNILLGARFGFAYGWRALIAAEMLFSISGLGFMIYDAQQYLATPLIILGMLLLGVIWLLIEELLLRPVEILTIQRWGLVQR